MQEFRGNDANGSNSHSRRKEHVKVWECFLSFGAESCVFQLAISKHEVHDTQDCTAAVLYGCDAWFLALTL